jgi:hypothetical protein
VWSITGSDFIRFRFEDESNAADGVSKYLPLERVMRGVDKDREERWLKISLRVTTYCVALVFFPLQKSESEFHKEEVYICEGKILIDSNTFFRIHCVSF